ncbi:sulfatase-like hydrolase/transferase [Ruegeria sp.]|uniref:sulfatase-like hydrolase/transferase n=1 Tax=Ruegeria sp. TaxID=1879320 RepID=UPI00231DCCE4|nr:sulfatase-like hydrolase/transferase [Ruegeria sp.]MDA7963031.1 sulfatase-like hydrolase/transferase [Ruegeria sp.]
MFKLGVLFFYLALPALLVIGPVTRNEGLRWALSIVFLTVFLFRAFGPIFTGRIPQVVLGTILVLLNAALSASFILQGTPFNEAFFAHLDASTVSIAWKTQPLSVLAFAAYVISAPLVLLWAGLNPVAQKLSQLMPTRRIFLLQLCSLLLCVGLSFPITAIAQHYLYIGKSSERLDATLAELRRQSLPAQIQMAERKNIVLLYLESVEQTYFDETQFSGLLPGLSKLREDAIAFTDVVQYPGTSWTIGGLVSSQCGIPLLTRQGGNAVLEKVDNPFQSFDCLAELLGGAGYNTAFVGGASLDFAGKGRFLRDNGYQVALGLDELPTSSRHSWGMFDDELFGHARQLFDGLSKEQAPFLLTLLTLDTHHPIGTPSPSCTPYAADASTMLNAVHCTDQLAWNFVEAIRSSDAADDTVVVIMSDHLVISGDVVSRFDGLDRRITFMLLDPARDAAVHSGPSSHFDVGPTILEAAGMQGVTFTFGQSLLAHPQGFLADRNLGEDDMKSFHVELLVQDRADGG